jgi:tellurite resistance protein TehA-like permease
VLASASASIVIHGWWNLAWALWWVSLVLWAAFVYTTLIAVVLDRDKPGLQGGINGSWFLLTVSTQSIAVVAGAAPHPNRQRRPRVHLRSPRSRSVSCSTSSS